MGEETNIEWARHTGGPWLGCTEVSPGCLFCYARDLAMKRLEHIFRTAYKSAGFEDWETRPVWGKKAPRVLTKGFWKDAKRLNRKAMDRTCSKGHRYPATYANLLHGKCYSCGERYEQMPHVRPRMFPSMIDWLDDMPAGIIDQTGNWLDKTDVLIWFLRAIHESSSLDWLLLTKRPEDFQKRLYSAYENLAEVNEVAPTQFNKSLQDWIDNWLRGNPPKNVWIGVSVEDQVRADQRIPALLKIPAVIRFLSCEPLLGPLDLELISYVGRSYDTDEIRDRHIDWIIVGGESGPQARPCNVNWIANVVAQCRQPKIPVFVKQLGENPVALDNPLKDRKGGNPSEWPVDLQVRQFPEVMDRVAA